MGERHPGWTRKRRDREESIERISPSWRMWLVATTTEMDQRRAFADNRRARLRAKRTMRIARAPWRMLTRQMNLAMFMDARTQAKGGRP